MLSRCGMVLSSLLQALRAELSLSLKTSSRRLAEVSARLVPILLSSLLNNRLDGQPLLASISLSGELRVASPHHLLSWYFGLWLQGPLRFVEQFPQTLPPPRGERYREALPEDNSVVPDETPRPLDVVAHDCFFHFLLCHVDRLLSCSRPGWSRRGGPAGVVSPHVAVVAPECFRLNVFALAGCSILSGWNRRSCGCMETIQPNG